LLLQHVAGAQVQELAVLLRTAGITPEQYHVLRVLRDARTGGLTCSAVAERSVSGDPDVTRLLDRLEKQGWVLRVRESSDRRMVTTGCRFSRSRNCDCGQLGACGLPPAQAQPRIDAPAASPGESLARRRWRFTSNRRYRGIEHEHRSRGEQSRCGPLEIAC